MAKWIVIDGVWHEPPGYAALWMRFGLSRASWLTMPRALMHEMPDDWQARMAELLAEYESHWDIPDCYAADLHVSAKRNGKFARLPDFITNYRHPDTEAIDRLRAQRHGRGEAGK